MGDEPQSTILAPGQPEPAFQAGPRRGRTRLILVVVLAVIVAGVAVGAFFLLRSRTTASPTPGSSQVTPSPAPHVPFVFALDRVRVVKLTSRSVEARVDATAEAIATQLSAFYDTAFADPASWKSGVPDDAWNVFAPSIRDRAKGETDSFTPATKGVDLLELTVSKSSLAVTLLFDASGRARAAFARVLFEGTGELKDGQQVEIVNATTLYLRPTSGEWLIAGYPLASTKVEVGTAAPISSPGATGSASPSAGSSP
jgi:hypothetical protein